jgi:hypothetical protein
MQLARRRDRDPAQAHQTLGGQNRFWVVAPQSGPRKIHHQGDGPAAGAVVVSRGVRMASWQSCVRHPGRPSLRLRRKPSRPPARQTWQRPRRCCPTSQGPRPGPDLGHTAASSGVSKPRSGARHFLTRKDFPGEEAAGRIAESLRALCAQCAALAPATGLPWPGRAVEEVSPRNRAHVEVLPSMSPPPRPHRHGSRRTNIPRRRRLHGRRTNILPGRGHRHRHRHRHHRSRCHNRGHRDQRLPSPCHSICRIQRRNIIKPRKFTPRRPAMRQAMRQRCRSRPKAARLRFTTWPRVQRRRSRPTGAGALTPSSAPSGASRLSTPTC